MKKIITLLATTLTFGIFSQTTGSIVNESGNSIFSYEIEHVNCFGQSNGSINLTPLTNENWSYSWDNQQNSEDIENLPSGIYRVIIKNNLGQIYFGSFTVEQPEELEAFINIENDVLDLLVVGGVEPYVYLWNTGDTTQDISYNHNGIFDVIIVDSNNCALSTNIYANLAINNLLEEKNNQSKIYPNPTNGLSKLIVGSEFDKLEVLDSNGKLIHQQTVGSEIEILLNFSSGVYLCKLSSVNNIETLKFIVE